MPNAKGRFLQDARMLVSKSLSGFTLIELMVTIAVGVILLTIAAPSFKEIIQNNRLATQVNDFVTALNLARSEAIKRGVRVTVCKSANSTSLTPACSNDNSGSNWQVGWMVFVDSDNNGNCVDANSDGMCDDDNGVILRVYGPLSGGGTLNVGNTVRDWISYLPSGTCQGSGGLPNDTFRLCDYRGTSSARSIVISFAGRIKTSVTTTACP